MAHQDWVVLVPDEIDDCEARPPPSLTEGDDSVRSPGQMIEEARRPVSEAEAGVRGRKPKGHQKGSMVVCKGEGPKRCRIGQVISISEVERIASVHQWRASVDGRLRVLWQPAFRNEAQQEVLGAGKFPALRPAQCADLLMVVELPSVSSAMPRPGG